MRSIGERGVMTDGIRCVFEHVHVHVLIAGYSVTCVANVEISRLL